MPDPCDTLQPDGLKWREVREDGAVDGGFVRLETPGEALEYPFALQRLLKGAKVVARVRLRGVVELHIDGMLRGAQTISGGSDEWQMVELGSGDFAAGALRFVLKHAGPPQRVDLDFIAIVPKDGRVLVSDRQWNPVPVRVAGPDGKSFTLAYPDIPGLSYGVWWSAEGHRVREWHCAALDLLMRHATHNHGTKVFRGDGLGHWTNVCLGTVAVGPHDAKEFYAVIAAGQEGASRKSACWPTFSIRNTCGAISE